MNQPTRRELFGPLDLMGVVLYGNPSTVRFHDAWVHFGKVGDEIALPRIGKSLYGLQLYPPSFPAVFEFTYMASIEKTPGITVPIRMLTKTVPQGSYVVQKVVGGVDGIDEALQYLYREYIPAKGLKLAMPFDFEKYCSVGGHDRLDGDIEVWVPVEE
jgi:predicted transcriptional regulator YdeE